MALQMNFSYKGIVVKEGYIKVFRFDGDKETLYFGVGYHSSSDGEMIFSESYSVDSYDLYGENPITQSYNYLKTLDKFELAIDV